MLQDKPLKTVDLSQQDLMKFSGDIQAIFTGWLKTVLVRKKKKVIHRQRRSCVTDISLDRLPFEPIGVEAIYTKPDKDDYAELFQFKNKRLEKAFLDLPERSRQVLAYLYVYEWKPDEIAMWLGKNRSYIYVIKSRAIAALRRKLCNEGKAKRP